jgi:predicted ATP-grasp superfamily ATP-dependent carboligase
MVAAARGLRAAGFAVTAAAPRSARPAPAHWSHAVSERLVVPHPLEDEQAFIAELERAVGSRRYAALIAGTDASLIAISRARDLLAPYTSLGLPAHEVVERSLEKLALAAAAVNHELAPPRTIACSSVEDALVAARELGFPVVVKPACSIVETDGVRRQVGSVRISDEASLELAVSRIGNRSLIQGVEPGPVLSFAGVFTGGQLLAEAVSYYRRTWYPEAGNASFSETVPCPPELRSRVVGLLGELGWEGLFELELIERSDGAWAAIDLNPRPYGSIALAIGAGANLPAIWCSHLLGRDPEPVAARPGVFYRWEDADLRHGLWQLRHRHVRAAASVMRMHRTVVHPFFTLSDPGPLVARMLFLAKSRRRRATAAPQRAAEQDVRDPHVPALLRRRRHRGRALPVVVIGAGPYGLAAAAHLRAARVPLRCFGDPLGFWREQMPAGMLLRSPRRATHIASPHRSLSIDRYERDTGKTVRRPTLTLNEFIDYGTWFQQQAVPELDRRKVTQVTRSDGGFTVRLEDGEQLDASRVVVAAGLAPFGTHPEPFDALPSELVSHASDHTDLGVFAGKQVAVIGGGQSALESAALLADQGAAVEVIVRAPAIKWLPDDTQPLPSGSSSIFSIPLAPTGVGGRASGWIGALPDAYHRSPDALQRWTTKRCLTPAGSGWLLPRLSASTISCPRAVRAVRALDGLIELRLDDGSERTVDHILLGTGYSVDVGRYPFLDPGLVAELDVVGGCPRLSPGLESSVAGLHFIGAPAVLSYGPVMRFVVGTWYAAPALTRRVLGRRQRLVRFAF